MKHPNYWVSSFLYYMWNAWSESECKEIFPGWLGDHIWEKWCHLKCAEKLYAELDEDARIKLVDRAVLLYDGRARKPIK